MNKAKEILQLTIKGFVGKEVGRRSAGLTYVGEKIPHRISHAEGGLYRPVEERLNFYRRIPAQAACQQKC